MGQETMADFCAVNGNCFTLSMAKNQVSQGRVSGKERRAFLKKAEKNCRGCEKLSVVEQTLRGDVTTKKPGLRRRIHHVVKAVDSRRGIVVHRAVSKMTWTIESRQERGGARVVKVNARKNTNKVNLDRSW